MINWLEKRRHFAIILTLLIAAEIFYFSSISGTETATGGINLSTAYHLIIFFLLNFFLLISVNGEKMIKVKYLIIALIVSLIYAILDEIHQIFVPFRYAGIRDVLIDGMGIFISALIYLYYKKPRKSI